MNVCTHTHTQIHQKKIGDYDEIEVEKLESLMSEVMETKKEFRSMRKEIKELKSQNKLMKRTIKDCFATLDKVMPNSMKKSIK